MTHDSLARNYINMTSLLVHVNPFRLGGVNSAGKSVLAM
jgi:hypothetical protein